MKPAPPDRGIPKLRPLRSLYFKDAALERREVIPVKLAEGKNKLKKNTAIQRKSIARLSETVRNGRDSTKMYGGINSLAKTGKCPQLNGLFLRPSIDVRSFHSKIMERANRLDETLPTDEVKCHTDFITFHADVKSTNGAKSATNRVCTPKASGMSRAYIKLSGFKKKLTAMKRECSPILVSPFEEKLALKQKNANTTQVVDKSEGNFLDANGNENLKTSDEGKAKENILPAEVFDLTEISNADLSTMFSANNENGVTKENVGHCVLGNILRHYQVYTNNMINVSKAMDILDDTFQKVIILEVGGDFHARFDEYQSRKHQMYRKMEVLERELEKSMKNEVDVLAKFEVYMRKKRDVMNECKHIHENFENVLSRTIESYEKEMAAEPAMYKTLEEISEALVSRKGMRDAEVRSVLRRSKRLSATSKVSHAETKSPVTDHEEKDELLLVKKCSTSYDRKRIPSYIYKDLQKTFNLCSPECSF